MRIGNSFSLGLEAALAGEVEGSQTKYMDEVDNDFDIKEDDVSEGEVLAGDIARMYAYVEREATRLGRAIYFVSYAFTVPSKTPVRQMGAHYLYKIQGLQEVA
jgi:hypothetical protein